MFRKSSNKDKKAASGGEAPEDIISYDDGFKKVNNTGIQPYLRMVEANDEFFKAKDFIALYDTIFQMCIQRDPYNHSERMYNAYKESINHYLVSKAAPLLQDKVSGSAPNVYLTEWKERWHKQTLVVKGMKKLFMYLDRFYTKNTDNVLTLDQQGYKLYKQNVFDTFSVVARNNILLCMDRERVDEEQDWNLLQDSVNVFVQMGYSYNEKKLTIYQSELEKHIVANAGKFYQRQSRMWMDQDSCPNYLRKVEKMLKQEKDRVDAYLHHTTQEPLSKECYKFLLKQHQEELLSKKTGVNAMLSANAREDLSRMYRLYSRHPSDLEPIARLFQVHVSQRGTEVVDNAKRSAPGKPVDANHALVRNLIDLHAQFNKIVVDCFNKENVFQKSLKNAFQDFINKDNRVSKLLAKFVNDVLKKGTKVNVKDVESTLDNVVFLYGYIQEKDVFERDYQGFLASRLLMGQCESEHNEKTMIAKLKAQCGYQWTGKLEGMFRDVQMSKELMEEFRKQIHAEKKQHAWDLEANVCTGAFWPSNRAVNGKLPEDLKAVCGNFKDFYLGKHSGRKIDWRLDQGQAEVRVKFSPGMTRGLVCSTYQMMILLCFNDSKIQTFKNILDITGIPKHEIQNHLLSLVHPKVDILKKRPTKKELNDDDKLMINPKYTNAMLNIHVPLLKAVEDPNAAAMEEKAIMLQRRHQMDAAVVRIMKARKTYSHAMLLAEVKQQLQARFNATPQATKKRIEALIEQEYLERDKTNRGVYNYLA